VPCTPLAAGSRQNYDRSGIPIRGLILLTALLFDSSQTLLNLFSINSSLLLVTPDLSHGTVGFGRQAEECVEELVALAI